MHTRGGGGAEPETTKIWTHIWAVINFFPFFCADTFDTSLLLTVCALKWYIKSLYRHLFLEDISKNARVTQKWHFLICGKLYSQAPWPQIPKLGVRVANALSCDRTDSLFFSGWIHPPPPPLPPRYSVEKRRTTDICMGVRQISVGVRQISVVPPLLSSISRGGGGGGFTRKKNETVRSQLRALATRTPSFGGQRSRRLAVKFATN